jgi:adenylate cyclase
VIIVLAGGILTAAIGLSCHLFSFAEPLQRLSYDLPFRARGTIATSEAVLVYLDDQSTTELHQGDTWDRTLHTKLLDRLTREKARLVFYDIVFDTPSSDPATDLTFAEAIKRQGTVILGAAFDVTDQAGVRQERVLPPIKPLRKAAAGWGLLVLRPLDPDYGVRQIYLGTPELPTTTWRAAEILGTRDALGPQETPRWINYYGPRDTFTSVNFARAIEPTGVPPDFFKNQIVLIGGRSALGYRGSRRDEFATPYGDFSPGLEIHATILLNLLHHEWLTRIPPHLEMAIIILVGLLAGIGLSLLRPSFALIAALLAIAALTAIECNLVWQHRLWFGWLVPAAVEIPYALVWSFGSQYLRESKRRKQLRRAFGFYLSPEMADRIANSDFDLSPGGKVVEVTVVFTDLENFTALSENLDPAEVSKILTDYFSQTTRCILENRGTIIKYVGDAVFAAWGAPLEEPAHALRAAETACRLRSLTELEVRGVKLRTRVGIHSGPGLAGNLGSAYRFDYTVIGDAVNLASRLESLNKYLHTQVLISDAVCNQLGDRFVTRRLGEFLVAGKTRSVILHELYCPRSDVSANWDWITVFEEGVKRFQVKDFGAARQAMDRTREMRDGRDGPAEFYLRKITTLEANGCGDDWKGVLEFTEK